MTLIHSELAVIHDENHVLGTIHQSGEIDQIHCRHDLTLMPPTPDAAFVFVFEVTTDGHVLLSHAGGADKTTRLIIQHGDDYYEVEREQTTNLSLLFSNGYGEIYYPESRRRLVFRDFRRPKPTALVMRSELREKTVYFLQELLKGGCSLTPAQKQVAVSDPELKETLKEIIQGKRL